MAPAVAGVLVPDIGQQASPCSRLLFLPEPPRLVGGIDMPSMPPTFRTPGRQARAEQKREADQRRGSARERGYDSKWDKAAKGHLDRNPLCRYCELTGDTVAATLVDHLYPHKGDRWVFWLKRLWVSSCKDCHDGFKQRVERAGKLALDDLAARLGLPTLDEMRRSRTDRA